MLAKDFLDTTKYKATLAHHFCEMLHLKGMLKYYMTQNFDNLELKAGFKKEEIIYAHGQNCGAMCSVCRAEADRGELEKKIADG